MGKKNNHQDLIVPDIVSDYIIKTIAEHIVITFNIKNNTIQTHKPISFPRKKE